MVKGWWLVVWTAVFGLLLLGVGSLGFIYSGVYDIAANEPHVAPFRWAVSTLTRRSIEEHAEDIEAPALEDPELVRNGLVLYQDLCLVCHGAPGVERLVIGRGMNPDPPRLAVDAPDWSDAELYWVIRNGIKMGGMPAFWPGRSEREIWALTAFVRRLPTLSEEEYARMILATQGRLDPAEVEWVERDDGGWARLLAQGRPERGRELLDAYGCGACHVIPGVRAAQGKAGPPLDRWAERHYVAGELLNHPDNLIAWIVGPQRIEPGSAMPDLGVAPGEALHMAAYLYTLGKLPLEARRPTTR